MTSNKRKRKSFYGTRKTSWNDRGEILDYTDKGGYGELQYTYQEGNTLYGTIHDVPFDGADPVEWAVAVEIPDHDHFIYRYFGVKGNKELHATRIK